MDRDEAAAGLHVPHQGDALGVGVEHDIVGVGEDEGAVLLQRVVGEHGRVVRNVHGELVLFGKRSYRLDRGRDVVVHVAGAVFGVEQHANLRPVGRRGLRAGGVSAAGPAISGSITADAAIRGAWVRTRRRSTRAPPRGRGVLFEGRTVVTVRRPVN